MSQYIQYTPLHWGRWPLSEIVSCEIQPTLYKEVKEIQYGFYFLKKSKTISLHILTSDRFAMFMLPHVSLYVYVCL